MTQLLKCVSNALEKVPSKLQSLRNAAGAESDEVFWDGPDLTEVIQSWSSGVESFRSFISPQMVQKIVSNDPMVMGAFLHTAYMSFPASTDGSGDLKVDLITGTLESLPSQSDADLPSAIIRLRGVLHDCVRDWFDIMEKLDVKILSANLYGDADGEIQISRIGFKANSGREGSHSDGDIQSQVERNPSCNWTLHFSHESSFNCIAGVIKRSSTAQETDVIAYAHPDSGIEPMFTVSMAPGSSKSLETSMALTVPPPALHFC